MIECKLSYYTYFFRYILGLILCAEKFKDLVKKKKLKDAIFSDLQ